MEKRKGGSAPRIRSEVLQRLYLQAGVGVTIFDPFLFFSFNRFPMKCSSSKASSGNFFDSDSSSPSSSPTDSGTRPWQEKQLCRGDNDLHRLETGTHVAKLSSDCPASSSDEDEDEWNSVDLSAPHAATTNCDSASLLGNGMFIPEPLIRVEFTREKPKLQFLSVEDLPPGKSVWVGDEDDVEVYMKKHWNDFYDRICNGQQMGTVKRHSRDMTLVNFYDESMEMTFSLTLPRSCLSTSKIEPQKFESSTSPSLRKKNFSLYLGKLHTRVSTYNSRDSLLANQLFYEAVSVFTIRTTDCPPLVKALKNFHSEFFSTALADVNNLISEANLYPSRLVDVLLLRSRIYVFQNKYLDALEDARCCISLEPRWVRGYLSAARAFSGIGCFDEAHEMIMKANTILPYTTELRHIMELNTFLRNQQKMLRKQNLFLSLDHLYRRRITPLSHVLPNEIMAMETVPTVVAASLFASWPQERCKYCFKLKDTHSQECSTNNDLDAFDNWGLDDALSKAVRLDTHFSFMQRNEEGTEYCSSECRSAAKETNHLYSQHNEAIQRARGKLKSMAPMIIDPRPLEIINLAIRLFFLVVQQHKHLLATIAKRRRSIADFVMWSRSTEPPLGQRYTPGLNAALRHTSFFPLVSGQMGEFMKMNAIKVHNILIESMSDEEKKLYNKELFLGLNRYIHAYYVSAQLEKSNEKVDEKFFFIPRFVGCICGNSEIEWLARVEIDSGNWSSESQYFFSLRTATNCKVQLVDLRTRTREELAKVMHLTEEARAADLSVPALALVSKKEIDPRSLLVPN